MNDPFIHKFFKNNIRLYLKKLNKQFIGNGKNEIKKIIIEYNKSIPLEFKLIEENNMINIYISNFLDYDNIEKSCLTIKISKRYKIASIEGISSENFTCFSNSVFVLKNEASFYLMMTIKMLKKYKNKFNINKIQLRDNAIIKLKNGLTYNLSLFKLLTEGKSWYEKYGFKINKTKKKEYNKSKKIYKKIKVKNFKLDNIIKKIKINDKNILNEINIILKIIKINLNIKMIKLMYFIFVENKNKYRYIIYALIIEKIKSRLIDKFDYIISIPTLFYMNI